MDDFESSQNETGEQHTSRLKRAQTTLTLFFILAALLGGMLADVGFGQHSPEKTCSDSDNTLEKIGIGLVLASFFCLGVNLVFLLLRLLFDWKTSLHALALVLVHAGCVLFSVVVFAEALLANAGCGVVAFAPINP